MATLYHDGDDLYDTLAAQWAAQGYPAFFTYGNIVYQALSDNGTRFFSSVDRKPEKSSFSHKALPNAFGYYGLADIWGQSPTND